LMLPSGRSIPASLSISAGSILILPTRIGGPLRLVPMAGEWLDARLCGSVGLLVCCRCRYQCAADQLRSCGRSSIFRARTTLCWSSRGCWPHCSRVVPIRCWQYLASKARRRRFCQSSPQGARGPERGPGTLPREERELMIAANNGHLLAFDNLSGLPAWLSDALCRLASGGSLAGCAVCAWLRAWPPRFSAAAGAQPDAGTQVSGTGQTVAHRGES
jgi:hypothetical protein